jgi:hypothetical protein
MKSDGGGGEPSGGGEGMTREEDDGNSSSTEESTGAAVALEGPEPTGPPPADPSPSAGPASNGSSGSGEVRRSVLGILVIASIVSLGTALFLTVSTADSALVAATWGLFIVISIWVVAALAWGVLNPPAQYEPDLSTLLRNAASIVITVDGVVLGLSTLCLQIRSSRTFR